MKKCHFFNIYCYNLKTYQVADNIFPTFSRTCCRIWTTVKIMFRAIDEGDGTILEHVAQPKAASAFRVKLALLLEIVTALFTTFTKEIQENVH